MDHVYCRQCGKAIAADSAFCPSCGTAQQAIPQTPAPTIGVVCLNCGGMPVQKISAVWRAGSSQSTTSMVSSVTGYGQHNHGSAVIYGHGWTQTQTHLAALFSPPSPPVSKSKSADAQFRLYVIVYIGVLVYVVFQTFLYALAARTHPEHYRGFLHYDMIILTVASTLIMMRCTGKHFSRKEKLEDSDDLHRWHYDRSMARWERIQYCPLCNCVFDPEENRIAACESVSDLVYR